MGFTRTKVLVEGDCRAWLFHDSVWQRVKILAAISLSGSLKSLVQFSDGRELEVSPDLLRFTDRKPQGKPKRSR